MGAPARILLCTEGTYPYDGGGVGTWCDILCQELREYAFSLYAVTGAPEVRLRYQLPPNVGQVVHVPLWGTREPAEYILGRFPGSAATRPRPSEADVQRHFVPLLTRLLEATAADSSPDDDGRLFWEMWRWFGERDWRTTWTSRATWYAFMEGTRAAEARHRERRGLEEEPLSLEDLAGALRWLSHYLLPLSTPLPEADLVHSSIAGAAGLVGIVASHERGTPFLLTEHGVWVRERYISVSTAPFSDYAKRSLLGLSRHLARANYRCADIVSPVTAFNRRWEVPFRARPERVRPVPNGVDPSLFVPAPKPAERRGRPVVVAAARVFPLKDIETMIRASQVTRDLLGDVHFLVYGSLDADVPYVERCRALIAELGVEDTFELAGHHTKPAELYNEGDISILSSTSEGFPYTVLESMACARPVVATDVGGVREALEGYGILVAPRDHEALGRAAALLLTDHELRARLGRQAREAVLARFRVSHSVDAYRDFYRDLLARSDAGDGAGGEGRPGGEAETAAQAA